MKLKWDIFIDQIKSEGYEGESDNLDQVRIWLRRKGHDPDKLIDTTSKETFDLQKLFDERPGKPLDVSEAAKKAEVQSQIDEGIQEALGDLENIYGKDLKNLKARKKDPDAKGHDYASDIQVKGEKLAEHPTAGYQHLGFFLKDIALACRAVSRSTSLNRFRDGRKLHWGRRPSLRRPLDRTADSPLRLNCAPTSRVRLRPRTRSWVGRGRFPLQGVDWFYPLIPRRSGARMASRRTRPAKRAQSRRPR
jgi:hypothetical protein